MEESPADARSPLRRDPARCRAVPSPSSGTCASARRTRRAQRMWRPAPSQQGEEPDPRSRRGCGPPPSSRRSRFQPERSGHHPDVDAHPAGRRARACSQALIVGAFLVLAIARTTPVGPPSSHLASLAAGAPRQPGGGRRGAGSRRRRPRRRRRPHPRSVSEHGPQPFGRAGVALAIGPGCRPRARPLRLAAPAPRALYRSRAATR